MTLLIIYLLAGIGLLSTLTIAAFCGWLLHMNRQERKLDRLLEKQEKEESN